MLKFACKLHSHPSRIASVSFSELRGEIEKEPVAKIMDLFSEHFTLEGNLERKIRGNSQSMPGLKETSGLEFVMEALSMCKVYSCAQRGTGQSGQRLQETMTQELKSLHSPSVRRLAQDAVGDSVL